MATVPLSQLLELDPLPGDIFRTRHHEANPAGRAFGGQVLAQALRAAAATVPVDREASAFQAVFLQGMRCDRPAEYHVTRLQDGKRLSTRHVRALQGERACLDAHASFEVPDPRAPQHQMSLSGGLPEPESLPSLDDFPPEVVDRLWRIGYHLAGKSTLDVRVADAQRDLVDGIGLGPFRFWIRATEPTGAAPGLDAALFTYLSDFWVAYPAIGPHVPLAESQARYTATLNHSIWWHGPVRSEDWLLVVAESPCASRGRGLAIARIYDRKRRLVASVAQEVLIAPRSE